MKDKTQNTEKEIEDNLEKMNYPANEDIYSKDKLITNADVEKISTNDQLNIEENLGNENAVDNEKLGNNLGVPGSELDDIQENIGSEDEENNYYSDADTK